MRFHVIGLAHTQTTKDYLQCAYTQKVIKFCSMLKSLGHTVYLYASEDNIAPCDELITCITKEQQRQFVPGGAYVNVPFDSESQYWKIFNENIIKKMKSRLEERDFLCLSTGIMQKPVIDAYPKHIAVEYGVGYSGVIAPYAVYESYAWMHTVYASKTGDPYQIDGRYFDAVIPNAIDPNDFAIKTERGDNFLFIGRLTPRKGLDIAIETTKRIGAELIVAGDGDYKPNEKHVKYIGPVDPDQRALLMSHAKAVFAPTTYVEPFGSVAVEAMFCGTPVITTDWGAFTETVQHGKVGYRCRTLEQFIYAARNIDKLISPELIALYAQENYSMAAISLMYKEYFEMLMTLWGEGWYSNSEARTQLSWLNKSYA